MNTNILPVLDILNNVRTVSDFLYVSQQATLPASLTKNHERLVTNFIDWKQDFWNEFWVGFINENLQSQVSTINGYYGDDIAPDTMQSIVKGLLYPEDGGPTPRLITSADALSNLVISGSGYATSLETIAEGIRDADKTKVAALLTTANTLSSQFDQQEQKLVDSSLKTAADVVVTAVNVAIAVGSEGETIDPLISSVSQLGQDVVTSLDLSSSINTTLSDLITAWNALDAASQELASIKLTIQKLKAITDTAGTTISALDNIATDWQIVADTSSESSTDWESTGNREMKEWSSRMVKVHFAVYTQNIS